MKKFGVALAFPCILFMSATLDISKTSNETVLNNLINGLFQNKCIESLDCFYTGPPFYNPIYRPISLSPSSDLGTELLIYSRTNIDNPMVLTPVEVSLNSSILDPHMDTKILIHGYSVKLQEDDIRFICHVNFAIGDIKQPGNIVALIVHFTNHRDKRNISEVLTYTYELLKHNPCNVIIVNWTANNQSPYPQAVANSRAVAAQVAKFLNFHVKNRDLDPKSVHVIGHSLGGQISGWVGERIPGLGRITGLDPAGPWFQRAENEVRLDPSDADFVDVIHTNGGNHMIEGLGLGESIGHLDFYPNGGNDQPGCFYEALQITNGDKDETTELIANSCDHSRANHYFLQSISRCQFIGVHCSSYRDFKDKKCTPENSVVAEMGYHAIKMQIPHNATNFFLQTSDKSPFCDDSNEIE